MIILITLWLSMAVSELINTTLLRDCYVGAPPYCNNSLTSDTSCRGVEVSTADGWKRMDCDYALYNIPTSQRYTQKWLVIHAGVCDTYTELLGDYFSASMSLNIFGLRPCGGFESSLCLANHQYSICNALHISWSLPPPVSSPRITDVGLGFNPPALVDIYHTPGTTMLFLHEYGDSNVSYNWFGAAGCNFDSKPLYMCIAGLDPNYAAKFAAIKATLEAGAQDSPWFPCKLEVVDTSPAVYGEAARPDVPCTGILRESNDPEKYGLDDSGSPNWAWEMTPFQTRAVQLATEVEPEGAFVQAFETAIDIALCKTFCEGQMACADDE